MDISNGTGLYPKPPWATWFVRHQHPVNVFTQKGAYIPFIVVHVGIRAYDGRKVGGGGDDDENNIVGPTAVLYPQLWKF